MLVFRIGFLILIHSPDTCASYINSCLPSESSIPGCVKPFPYCWSFALKLGSPAVGPTWFGSSHRWEPRGTTEQNMIHAAQQCILIWYFKFSRTWSKCTIKKILYILRGQEASGGIILPATISNVPYIHSKKSCWSLIYLQKRSLSMLNQLFPLPLFHLPLLPPLGLRYMPQLQQPTSTVRYN